MRTRALIFLIFSLAAFGCGKKNGESARNLPEFKLTEQQTKDGWLALFNGQDLEGWRPYKFRENSRWEVDDDGAIHCKPSSGDAISSRADLITIDEFSNFEVEAEWKIPKGGRSGFVYRATEVYDDAGKTGPAYAIGESNESDPFVSGGCDGMYTPAPDAKAKLAGEWNLTKIVVRGGLVEHWLNGVKACTYELGTDDWRNKKLSGTWKDAGAYGLAKNGHLALQDRGTEVWFRNIIIKKI